MDLKLEKEEAIKQLVYKSIESFATTFQDRHISEFNDLDGTLNMKIHNVFVSALGPETQFYSALVRSLDSSVGNMLESLAIDIAKLSYEVTQRVEGPLMVSQTTGIAELLEKYKRHEIKPKISDYDFLRNKPDDKTLITKRHESDYCLIDRDTNQYSLIELKIGGDLDNKKSRSEKEALLEQFAILSNSLESNSKIKIYFATAYNRYGENKEWKQERVKQFFANEELLIGKDFWNFICKSENGYELVLNAYKEKSDLIKNAIKIIKDKYLS